MADQQAKKPRYSQMDAEELSILCEQVALILRSGLPLYDGMDALCENYKNTRLSEHFDILNRSVQRTGSLYQGLVDAGIFPSYMEEMAHIGERTGELDTVMTGLAHYYHREAKIRHAISGAITYPMILIAIMSALVAVLVIRVLPIFEDVFRSLGIDTASNPWLSMGVGIGKTVLIAAGIVIALTLLVLLILRLDTSLRFRNALFRLFSPLRRTSNQISASRFASVMAMMLKSGFPLDESLKLVHGVIGDEDVARRVETCRCRMEEGISFPVAVDEMGIFEPLHSRMIHVGFQAGQTDAVMSKLAEIYEDKADDAISQTVAIIEPTLVALMSVIIGSVLLAIMLPLLSLMSGMV